MAGRSFADEDEADIRAAGSFMSPGLADLAAFTSEHLDFHRRRDGHLANAMRIEHRSLVAIQRQVDAALAAVDAVLSALRALAWIAASLLCCSALLVMAVVLR